MLFKGPYTEMFEEEMARIRRRFNKYGNLNVVHHETCPICGAKLVNLYRRENEWRCRRCWEKHDADPQPTMKLGPGKLYLVDKEGTHTLLAEVKEGWTPGMTEAEYRRLRASCSFLQPCIEGLTCHHSANIPQGESWGKCDWMSCPMNKYLED